MTSEMFYGSRDGVARALSDHWRLFLFEGILLVFSGFVAVGRGTKISGPRSRGHGSALITPPPH
jgi:hypothetical protein